MALEKKQESLSKIESLIHQGKSDVAEARISNFIKKNKLSDTDKIRLSEFYLWLGNIDRALKILGSPPNLAEIKNQPSSTRLLLMRRADLFHFLGANHSAQSIFNVLKENPIEENQKFHYCFWLGRLALTKYDFFSARKRFQQALSENPSHIIAQLGLADALESSGKQKEALQILEDLKPLEPTMKAIVEQMKGEFFTKLNLHDSAQEHFEQSLNLFKTETSSKDKVYLLQWWGVSLLEQGRTQEALQKIKDAQTMLMDCGAQPTMVIALNYLLNKMGEATYEENLQLYLDTVYSPYRHMLPILNHPTSFPLHPWIEDRTLSAKFDGVRLVPTQKTLKLIQFNNFTSDALASLNLNEGFFLTDNKKIKLTIYRVRVLRALIGSGTRGINEYRLCDEVYQSTMWNFNLDLDRLKKLIKEVKSLGFKISKSSGSYILDLSAEKFEILCPTRT